MLATSIRTLEEVLEFLETLTAQYHSVLDGTSGSGIWFANGKSDVMERFAGMQLDKALVGRAVALGVRMASVVKEVTGGNKR